MCVLDRILHNKNKARNITRASRVSIAKSKASLKIEHIWHARQVL